MKNLTNEQIMIRVTSISLIANIILAILKAVVGFIFFNVAVLSDAVHSVADVLTSVLVIVAALMANPKPDKKHNYGHEKIGSLIYLLFGFLLVGVGVFLGYQGTMGIISPSTGNIHFMLIAVTVLAILVKEAVFWFTMHYAKKIDSDIMKADAWHSRLDGLSSIAVLIGLITAHFVGSDLGESIAILIVSLFILKIAIESIIKAAGQLTDKSANAETCEKIKQIALNIDGKLTVEESHTIARVVHDVLEYDDKLKIKHCTVHVHPFKEKEIASSK